MTKKNIALTEVKALAQALEIVKANGGSTELVDKLARMYEVRATKGANKKPSPKQLENKVIAQNIIGIFASENNAPHTVSEIFAILDGREWKEPLNVQRVSRIMTNLTEEGELERFVERKVALFRVASH